MKEIDIEKIKFIKELNWDIIKLNDQLIHFKINSLIYSQINYQVRSRIWDGFWIKIMEQVNETK